MDYSQLELFQELNDYENKIFERAKKLKLIVTNAYSKIKLAELKDDIQQNYAVLNVTVKIQHIREGDPESQPNSPKMFIWQFAPTISLLVNEQQTLVVAANNSLKNTSAKIIPQWINSLFTTDSFSKGMFKQLAKQCYILNLLIDVFSDEQVFATIVEKIGDKDLLINMDSKIFARIRNEPTSMFERDVINKVKNLFFKLKGFQKENWFMVGHYEDFVDDSDLLGSLDQNDYIKKEIDNTVGLQKNGHSLTSLYQNDYLFLNNAEFVNETPNTDDWDCKYVMSPKIINSTFEAIDDKKLNQVVGGQINEIFCYQKYGGEHFIRKEIVFPKKNLSIEKFEEILNVSQKT